MKLLVFCALLGLASCQKLIDLKSFRNGDNGKLTTSTTQVGIYVSAYSDDSALLNQIFVTAPGQPQVSLQTLKTKKLLQTSGELQPFAITSDYYITTKLSNTQLNGLTGVLYICTTQQLLDQNFHVIDVDQRQDFTTAGIAAPSATFVFLNSHMDTSPKQSTMFESWTQKAGNSLSMYRGVPTDGGEAKYSQIFSNPVQMYPDAQQFFSTVEKFSLSLEAFYIKTAGSVGFRLSPNSHNIDGTTTSDMTTTGFYMKPIGDRDSERTVHTRRDAQYSGVTGANTIGTLPTGGKVYVGEYLNSGLKRQDETSFPPSNSIFFWTTPFIGDDFKVSSTNGQAGEFYVQYFVIQGAVTGGTTAKPGSPTLPPINPGNPTQGRVETTTKSSGPVQILTGLMIVALGYLH